MKFEDLEGKTLTNVTVNEDSDEILFETKESSYKMFHQEECCESVEIEDIVGDLKDLIGEPILLAEEIIEEGDKYCATYTNTFYKLRTINGSVDIRWYGTSNGYYSERVDFMEVK